MSVVRGDHNKQNPYAQISRACLQDTNLSWEAVGMLAYFLSLPTNWKISVSHLIKIRVAKEHKVYRILNELRQFGYCSRNEVRENGRFKEYEYVIHEIPDLTVKECVHNKCEPLGGFPVAEKPDAGNPPPTKTIEEDIYNNNDIPVEKPTEPCELPSSHECKFTVFDPHNYKLKNGERLQLRTARAFAKYTGKAKERLQANVFWYESYIDSGKEVKRSHEALLQWAVKTDAASKEDLSFQNTLYAKMMMLEHNLSNVKILKTVMQIKDQYSSMSETISLTLPNATFINILDSYIKKQKG